MPPEYTKHRTSSTRNDRAEHPSPAEHRLMREYGVSEARARVIADFQGYSSGDDDLSLRRRT